MAYTDKKKRRRDPSQFWEVADFFRTRSPPWNPANAGYEFLRHIEVEKKKWIICLKIHIVPDTSGAGERATQLKFHASVTIWPPDLSKQNERHLAKAGWYAAIEQALQRFGYRGRWSRAPSGRYGDFWKELQSIADVRRESKRLEEFRCTCLPSDNGQSPDLG